MKIALVHNWPGQKNSELELIKRIIRIAGDLGHECSVIDPFGHPLGTDGKHFDSVEFLDLRQYNFCLNLHYVNLNFFDTFSYAVNWNPLDYVVRHPMDGSDLPADHIAYRTACLDSHDAFLSAGSEEMDDFAASLNLVGGLHIVNSDLCLHTTSDVAEDLDFSDLEDFRVFYIGANWERQQGSGRHGGLIKRLDATNVINFYGVRKQNGIFLWEGIKNYKGELPFDGGKSILKKSNQCGVSLVLHSKAHRKSGLASTRIFQACAAKTVTICDDNPFVLKYFGDSVLSFEYGDNPDQNHDRILENIEWIRHHPDEANKMARKAHSIFVENFSLHKEVSNLLENHEADIARHLDKFGARDTSVTVDVLYLYSGHQDSALESFFNDLEAQVGVCPRAVLFVPPGQEEDVRKFASGRSLKYKIVESDEENEDSLPLDGRLVACYLKAYAESPWFAIYSCNCRWKRMHLSQLVRAADDSGDAAVAISGVFVKNEEFSNLTDDYYFLSMNSIGGYPKGITTGDIGNYAAGKFLSSALLFATAVFQEQTLLRTLRFFDKGWAFFLVTWYYLKTDNLPVFMPKLTTIFIRNDEQWEVDSYLAGRQSEAFERSLALAFFKNDPHYLSIMGLSSNSGPGNFARFSLNEFMLDILRFRPLLLKVYRSCFKAACFVLGLPSGKSSKKDKTDSG